jgi:hypothetical protein
MLAIGKIDYLEDLVEVLPLHAICHVKQRVERLHFVKLYIHILLFYCRLYQSVFVCLRRRQCPHCRNLKGNFAVVCHNSMGLTGAKVGRNFEMTKFLHTEITESTERGVTNTNSTNDTN